MNYGIRKKIISSLLISFFFAGTLLFFGPVHLYFTNILEFSSSFSEVALFFIGLTVLGTALLATVMALLKGSAHEKAVSVVLGLAVCLWVQGNILVWRYGLLDGRDIDWSAKRVCGLIDTPIWVLLIGSSLMAARWLHKLAPKVSVGLVLTQIISVSLAIAQAPGVSRSPLAGLGAREEIFRFSSERNVVVLVLDAFQGDVFQQIIEEDPQYREMFDGFTYYRNALGGYPSTYPTVPLILTGRYYDNSIPIQDFIKETFDGASLPKLLKQRGYQVDLMSYGKTIYSDEAIASVTVDIDKVVRRDSAIGEAASVIDLTLFRHLPHFTKKYVYNDQAWLFANLVMNKTLGRFPPTHRNSIVFMRELADQLNVSSEQPTFKYLHTYGSHPPVRFDERLQYAEMTNSRENYRKQAKGNLRLVEGFLDSLKRFAAYDNTMLFVIADHGLAG
jgi:hypothetical protein